MNDAKPDVASLPANVRELIGQLVSMAAITDADAARNVAERIDAALAPAGEGGLPELPTPHGPWHATSDDTGYYTYTADQMLAIRDAGIAYGRRLATPEQPGSSVQGEAVAKIYAGVGFVTLVEWLDASRDLPEGEYLLSTTPPPAPAADHIADADKMVQPEARGVEGETHAILRWIMREAEAAKEPCGSDPESSAAIRNGRLASIAQAAAQALGIVRGPSYATPNPVRAEQPEGMVLVPRTLTLPIANALGYDDAFNTWEEMQETWTEALAAAPAAPGVRVDEYQPQQGEPPSWFDEWFIAKLDTGERVVLRRLPEEYAYDYKTADHTYFKAFRLKWWMQFPDSKFNQLTAALATDGGKVSP